MSRKTTKFRWKKDRFLVLIAIITVATVSVTGNLKSLDKGLFSLFNRLTPINLTSTRIELITVNQKKLESVGDWPLNRANIAHMLKLVASGKPDIIATTLPLDGRQYTAGFREIYHLDSIFKKKGINNLTAVINEIKKNRNTLNNNTLDKLKKNLKDFSNQLDLATKKMDQDSILSQELGRINKIDLAYTYAYTKNNSKNAASPSLHHSLLNNQTSLKISGLPKNKALIQANSLILPLNDFIKNVTGSGAVKVAKRSRTDLDKTPLVISYRGTELPSLALLIAAQNLHTNLTSIHYMPSRHILKLGTLNIHTGQSLTIYPRDYTDGISSYKKFKYIDVLKNKINPKVFRHKIILIGIKNTKSSQFVNASGISLLANQIYSILNQDSVYSPYWSSYLRYSLFFLASIYLLIISPFLGKWLVDATTLIVLFILFLCSFYLFYKNGIWIPLAGPILILLAVYLLFKSKQILFGNHGLMTKSNTHHEKKQLIGLAFQNQGRLDLAYEQYCQLPINEYSLELLYSLGLEYQRSNNSEKARNIYQYIKKHRPEFRDVQTRLLHPHSNRDNRASHLNHYDANTNTGTAILGSYDNKTMMLGRYEVDHEIGRGAMSTVYQGKDPTIGRKVAIKTLLLSNEFEGEELEEVKARFYREAETAGRLSHPNIVTIFDAGEQDDIAYIAMEYLKGKNLTHHLHIDNLLPVPVVLEIVAKCALALDYAHHHHVIHRDVKPANIVYNPENKTIKLTDFGIARITDASKTRTGVIMGTPSYMSPEQLAGGNFDGRSDLFSLGITCYQLLTGTLPFQADSMATLMFKITNEAHPALNAIRDDLVPCVSPIINKTLQKNPDKRYQTGRALANQLLNCIREIRKETN